MARSKPKNKISTSSKASSKRQSRLSSKVGSKKKTLQETETDSVNGDGLQPDKEQHPSLDDPVTAGDMDVVVDNAVEGQAEAESIGVTSENAEPLVIQYPLTYEDYMNLRLKQFEKDILKKYNAAVLIQKIFRGFLIRSNMDILRRAAIKIQAAWRGAITRQWYKTMLEERKSQEFHELQNKMATKIQAAWRGYHSRYTVFDYKAYKGIEAINRQAEEAAKIANDIESFLSGSPHVSISQDEETEEEVLNILRTNSEMLNSLQYLLEADVDELAKKLSSARICQLYQHIQSQARISGAEPRKSFKKSQHKIGEGYQHAKSKSRARISGASTGSEARSSFNSQFSQQEIAKDLQKPTLMDHKKRRCTEHKPKTEPQSIPESESSDEEFNVEEEDDEELLSGVMKTESDELFPQLPATNDYYHVDQRKVTLLKAAIKQLRANIQQEELNKLAKVHYLMRTAAIPGVYSDVYTNEYSEMEQKMKQLTFLDKQKKKKPTKMLEDIREKSRFRPESIRLLLDKNSASANRASKEISYSQLNARVQFQNPRPRRNVSASSRRKNVDDEVQGLCAYQYKCTSDFCCDPKEYYVNEGERHVNPNLCYSSKQQ